MRLVAESSHVRSRAKRTASMDENHFVALGTGFPRGFSSPALIRIGMSCSAKPRTRAMREASIRAGNCSCAQAIIVESVKLLSGFFIWPVNSPRCSGFKSASRLNASRAKLSDLPVRPGLFSPAHVSVASRMVIGMEQFEVIHCLHFFLAGQFHSGEKRKHISKTKLFLHHRKWPRL
jgi:hypothetical protein